MVYFHGGVDHLVILGPANISNPQQVPDFIPTKVMRERRKTLPNCQLTGMSAISVPQSYSQVFRGGVYNAPVVPGRCSSVRERLTSEFDQVEPA